MKGTMRTASRKALAVLCSAALVSTMAAPVSAYASAEDDQAAVPTSALATADASGASYVTGYTVKRATPTLPMLGISLVVEGTLTLGDEYEGYGEDHTYDSTWSSAKYWLMASGYNSNPDPYLANFGTGYGDATNSATTAGSIATSYLSASDDVQATWDLQPDIIFNFNSGVSSPASQYLLDEDGETVLSQFADYDPAVLNYSTSDDGTWETAIDNLMSVAEAADEIVEESDGTKVLRYGSAVDIVESYEDYIYGTLGYVASAIDEGSVAKRTYAVVSGVTDNGDGSYTWALEASGVYNQTMASGIARDLIDVLGIEGTEVSETNSKTGKTSTTTYYYCTTEQLAQADLVVSGAANNEDQLEALEAVGLLDKAYITTAIGQGTIFNSFTGVEVGQNVGRVLGCLYPELVDQDIWMGYFLENYYHVNASDVPYLMSKLFEGVTNWDAEDANGDGTLSYEERVAWGEADGADYDPEIVEAAIETGTKYLEGLSSEEQSYIINASGLTKYESEADKTELDAAIAEANETLASGALADDVAEALSAAIQGAQAVSNDGAATADEVAAAIDTLASVVEGYASTLSVTVTEDAHYTGEAVEPAVTVTNALGQTLVEGTDYVLVYTNNVSAGTGTVYAIGIGSVAGFAKATFAIDKLALSGKGSYAKRVTSSAFTLNTTANIDGATLSYSSSKTSVAKVSGSGKVTIKGTGTATIAVTAAKSGYKSVTKSVKVTVGKPATPTLKSVKSAKNARVTVKAKGTVGVTGYQIYYKVAGKAAKKVKVKGSVKTLSKTLKGLASKKTCTVKVRAYKTLSGKTFYSSWSSTKKVTVK